MKIEDNHYTYRIETKDSNGGSLDFIDIDTVEPLRCAYDVQDELNLETNEHIKRVEEVVLDANSTEFWYVDEVRTSDTHLVCYFEEVELMASKDHPMVDTNRSVFEYGKINSNEHQDTNFICTHVMDNGVSRLYMSIDKTIFEFATFNNETIKHFISNNPVTVWYALRYEVIIPRSMSKGHLLTLSGQTDITLTTTSEQAKLPIMKFNIGDTQYTLDNNPIHINNTQEGTQIRNIVLEGNTPINYARGNGVNTTEQVSNTRYDFEPFYDGEATIQGTIEGGYVSAKLYGDTMVNIAKSYGETPLLTATNESTLCDDLLGMNEEGIVLTDGEITEGRIYGDSLVNLIDGTEVTLTATGNYVVRTAKPTIPIKPSTKYTLFTYVINNTLNGKTVFGRDGGGETKVNLDGTVTVEAKQTGIFKLLMTSREIVDRTYIDLRQQIHQEATEGSITYKQVLLEGDLTDKVISHFNGIGSVVNPNIKIVNNNLINPSLFKQKINIALIDGGVMVDGDTSVGWQSFYNNTTAIKLLANHTYKLRAFLLEGEYTGGNLRYTLSNNTAKEAPYTNTFTITPTTDAYLTALSFYTPSGVGAKFGISLIETTNDLDTYIPYKSSKITATYTLNKLPNGVADYIDVVNKVHVQRVGYVEDASVLNWSEYTNLNNTYTCYFLHDKLPQIAKNNTTFLCIGVENRNSTTIDKSLYSAGNMSLLTFIKDTTPLVSYDIEGFKTKLAELGVKFLYELATPIYTPLTEEEIAQLPLSAYADGYVNLSSDQLMPSFEFRMKASNRYQVDMLETGYYYLNAPVGNVKLGTANVDAQQMPCVIKVDNVGTGDSGYRLTTSATNGFNITIPESDMIDGGYFYPTDGAFVQHSNMCYSAIYYKILPNTVYGIFSPNNMRIQLYTENQSFIRTIERDGGWICFTTTSDTKYFRFSHNIYSKKGHTLIANPITLAKLPSHRIPTTFTQGMKCGTDFGYWEGIKVATGKQLYVNETNQLNFDAIELNRIEYNNTIVEDEFDIATGKFTKRIEKVTLNGSENWNYNALGNNAKTRAYQSNLTKQGNGYVAFSDKLPFYAYWSNDKSRVWLDGSGARIVVHLLHEIMYNVDNFKQYLASNPLTIYYELAVPEISYVNLSSNQVKTVASSTLLQSWRANTTYLNPQIKPSHLTYPVPSLVGNRTYTVVHNRKNITGSTKPIELNLGGTVVQLNDASSKTLVKTPSTLAHSNLIFIGGESTVDHIMVLDGDWTNKPIEYFENMMGHDTDAIITIIGNGQINDVEEQYLW